MRTAAVGILAFALFCAALAPAGLFAILIERFGGASLTATAGTIWSGSGALRLKRLGLGRLHWSFDPVTLTQLAPGYTWRLAGDSLDLHGSMAFHGDAIKLSASGAVGTAAVNAGLAAYDIRLDGGFDIEGLDATVTAEGLQRLDGSGRWSGGVVSYALGSQSHTALLPPMRAEAQSPPVRARAFAEAGSALLIQAEIMVGGYVKIGITRRLLQLLNQPWAGTGADDEIVVSVEEAVF
ncbi:MAG: type II secretion system protein N [Gammaproteobacteria bacterium]|nr:type II secretion system protein N [Gammaproteobacteria bacterium]